MQRRLRNIMIKLKEIKRNSGTITCKAYVEDCKEAISLSFDISTSMIKDVPLPQGYDWCDSHISHAKDYLMEIASKETIPDNHTIMWY